MSVDFQTQRTRKLPTHPLLLMLTPFSLSHSCDRYSLMMSCWEQQPTARPLFSVLTSELSRLHRRNTLSSTRSSSRSSSEVSSAVPEKKTPLETFSSRNKINLHGVMTQSPASTRPSTTSTRPSLNSKSELQAPRSTSSSQHSTRHDVNVVSSTPPNTLSSNISIPNSVPLHSQAIALVSQRPPTSSVSTSHIARGDNHYVRNPGLEGEDEETAI